MQIPRLFADSRPQAQSAIRVTSARAFSQFDFYDPDPTRVPGF
ncbi:hypothetical protein [Leptolyngbya sp. FACHB-261]|nr:hypothetical protein [Leptolyngbya sp. FACHB-261]